MAYSNVPLGVSNPGCIIILVDQSWFMEMPFGDSTKAESTAMIANRLLEEFVWGVP